MIEVSGLRILGVRFRKQLLSDIPFEASYVQAQKSKHAGYHGVSRPNLRGHMTPSRTYLLTPLICDRSSLSASAPNALHAILSAFCSS